MEINTTIKISVFDTIEDLHAEVTAYLQNLEDALEILGIELSAARFTLTDLGLEALGLDETEIGMYHAGELVW